MNRGLDRDVLARVLGGSTLRDQLRLLNTEALADTAGLNQLLDEADEFAHTAPGTAESLIDVVVAQAGADGLVSLQARGHYLGARIRAERGDFDEALTLIGVARQLWMEAGEQLSALRTDLGRMQIMDDLGQHAEAITIGERLLEAVGHRDQDDQDDQDTEQSVLASTLVANAWCNIGIASGFLGEHGLSLQAYERAEAAYERLGLTSNVAQQLVNRSIELTSLGRLTEARDLLVSATEVFKELGDSFYAAKTGTYLAEVRGHLGELVEALKGLEQARLTFADLGMRAEQTRVQLEVAKVYLRAGLFNDAAASAQEAGVEMSVAGARHDAAFAALTAALGFLGAGDLGKAEVELEVAIGLFDEVGDRQYRAQARLAAADIAMRRGRADEAAVLASIAEAEMVAGGWQVSLAWARLRQFDLCPDPDQGNAYLDAASPLVDELGLPALRYAHTLRSARTARARGDLEVSQTLLRRAIASVQDAGYGLPDAMLRTAFRADKFAAHNDLVDQLVDGESHQVIEAARLADQAKASTLTDLIDGTLGRDTRYRDFSGRRDTELGSLQSQLSETYGALQVTAPSSHRDQIRERAQFLEHQISARRLRAAVINAPSRPEGVQKSPAQDVWVLPGRPVLSYHVVGQDLLAFASQGGRVRVRRLGAVLVDVDRALDRLNAQWSRMRMGRQFAARRGDALRRSTDEVLRALYRLLVEPVQDLIDDWGTTGFVVVPHRELHRVPFHALHDGTGYLVQRWEIVLSPVLPHDGVPGTAALSERSGMLILAAPDESAPSIAQEATELQTVMPDAFIASGAAATSDLLRNRLPGPRYLHLACHGLYRAANPLFSALSLADGWITGADVMELDMGGALVTLSACESGRAATDTAEPVGLAWAFLAAGASGVVVSQWIVDDATTSELMVAMYRHLKEGHSPGSALRQAQLAAACDYPHPYYWAPFVHVMSPNSTEQETTS